jgi:hypothetical protein
MHGLGASTWGIGWVGGEPPLAGRGGVDSVGGF